jgi:predicted glycoside hydrolase/deacetylase ChbG (UPF0249 family)
MRGAADRDHDRTVVLHADDFGMNTPINAGILRSFREGLLTSTSLMANAPAVDEACAAWPKLADDLRAGSVASAASRRKLSDELRPFDLGVHLNLTQGRPLSTNYPAELLDTQGRFPGVGSVFRRLHREGSRFRDGVLTELQLQVERILDEGIRPTHLNGHQYIELIPGVAELIPELARKNSIGTVRLACEPYLARTVLREGRAATYAVALVKRHYARRAQSRPDTRLLVATDRFFGTAHAGLVNRATLERFLTFAGAGGCTEIGLHPAERSESDVRSSSDPWFDPLAGTRPIELDWLCESSTCDLIASKGLKLGRLSRIDP